MCTCKSGACGRQKVKPSPLQDKQVLLPMKASLQLWSSIFLTLKNESSGSEGLQGQAVSMMPSLVSLTLLRKCKDNKLEEK